MRRQCRHSGFTLVELLVALFAMALLAVLSWRGLDGMSRAQVQTEARADEVLTLQTGLAQWGADLDAMTQIPQFSAIDWNGRVLRITRSATTSAADGMVVVAWARRGGSGAGTWLRWQSPPLTTRGQLNDAWLRADAWSQNPGDEERRYEVAITQLAEWQIFYFRGDAWTNPQSSDATTVQGLTAAPVQTTPGVRTAVIPDGVRLVLMLPEGQAISGVIQRDWVRPTVGGGKS